MHDLLPKKKGAVQGDEIMKEGETKYPGEIMKRMSWRRWNQGNSFYLSMKTVSEVLAEAKKDIAADINFESMVRQLVEKTSSPYPEITKDNAQYLARVYRHRLIKTLTKIEKWFGV